MVPVSHDINQKAWRHSDQSLNCQLVNMSVTSSADVRSRYMHLSFLFEVMG